MGPLNQDGTFDVTGTGDVAGQHDIGVEFVDKITAETLTGTSSMGVKVPAIVNGNQLVGGLLASGKPVVYSVQGPRVGAQSPCGYLRWQPRLTRDLRLEAALHDRPDTPRLLAAGCAAAV